MATNEYNREDSRLEELGGSDYEMRDGEPNIKGWDVKDSAGHDIGDVDELIFDKQSLKVRYIVLDLDSDELNLKDRKVLVPVGLAQLDEKNDDVLLPNVTSEQLRALPAYTKNGITPEVESSIRNIFEGGALAGGAAALVGGSGAREDFYNHDHFNEENMYRNRQGVQDETTIPVVEENLEIGKREVETGKVRIRSRVVETPVEEHVHLRQESVRVESQPVDRPITEDDFKAAERTVEMKETDEVPVVRKDARIVEEVRVTKDVEQRDESVQDTIRRTDVDVDRTGQNTSSENDSL